MHFVKCKMMTILGKFSKIQERFKIKTSEYNHGKRRAAGKIGENINCFLLNEKYMLFGGKIKMKNVVKAIERGIVKGAIWIYCKIVYRFKVVGKDNIPKEGPVIICGNHRSFLDPPLIEITTGRYTRFLAKEELTKNKFLAFLGYVFDSILVKRDSKEVVALKESLKTLKNGDCLALFPEGTRNGLAKGEKVKDGAAFFAVRSGAPVVPCGIKGGTKGDWKVTITYGKPLDFSQYKGSKDKEILDKVTEEIMNNIIELAK